LLHLSHRGWRADADLRTRARRRHRWLGRGREVGVHSPTWRGSAARHEARTHDREERALEGADAAGSGRGLDDRAGARDAGREVLRVLLHAQSRRSLRRGRSEEVTLSAGTKLGHYEVLTRNSSGPLRGPWKQEGKSRLDALLRNGSPQT